MDDTSKTPEQPVWLPGWYATRLHALPANKGVPQGSVAAQALCGAWVYGKAPTEWAQRKMDKGVPHCKLCEKKLLPAPAVS